MNLARRMAGEPHSIGMLWEIVRHEIKNANPDCSWCGAVLQDADRVLLCSSDETCSWRRVVVHRACASPLVKALKRGPL